MIPLEIKRHLDFCQRNERGWMLFFKSWFIVWVLNKEPDNYTWWTMRFPSARLNNKDGVLIIVY
jgi:hypothetical protein